MRASADLHAEPVPPLYRRLALCLVAIVGVVAAAIVIGWRL